MQHIGITDVCSTLISNLCAIFRRFIIPKDEFTAFRFWLKQMQEMYAETEMPEHKKGIIIPTPCEGIKLLFSKTELTSFNTMLENADTEMQSLELMALFH